MKQESFSQASRAEYPVGEKILRGSALIGVVLMREHHDESQGVHVGRWQG